MGLPTPLKNWLIYTIVGDLTGNDELNQCDAVVQMFNKRTEVGHGVAGSGDQTTGGMDSENRLTDRDFLSASPGDEDRWIVFTQPGSGAQDLLVHSNNGQSDWSFSHSPSGAFTGGGVGVAPTAFDQSTPYNNSFFGLDDGGHDHPFIIHLWFSSDLTCFRQVYFWNNIHFGSIFYDEFVDTPTQWEYPNYALIDKNGFAKSFPQDCGNVNRWVSNLYTFPSDKGLFFTWGPDGEMNMSGTIESGMTYGTGTVTPIMNLITDKNAFTNTYRHIPTMGAYRNPEYGHPGWNGRIPDIWWVPDLFNPGDTTDLGGSNEFVIFKNQMMIWNKTPFQTF